MRRDKQGKIELVIAHVDDILTALKKETSEAFWTHVSKYVTIERKGRPETLLGMHLESRAYQKAYFRCTRPVLQNSQLPLPILPG